MKKILARLRNSDLLYAILLLIVGTAAYLLLINRLGFYGDDWYVIFDAHTQGPAFLRYVFSSDRPAEGLYLSLAYAVFGEHLLWYHLISFLYRYLAALVLFWILNRVWSARKEANFLIVLFFLLYPGYFGQFDPIIYQVHSLSLCLAMGSIALTVMAIGTKTSMAKLILWVVAGITAWIYLGLLEYHIGMEFLRLFFVGLASWHESTETVRAKVVRSIKNWFPYVIAPVCFLLWRVFFFTSTRVATDITAQIGGFSSAPGDTVLRWLANAFYSMWNIVISAWVVPFYGVFSQLSLRDKLITFGISAGCAILVFICLYRWTNGSIKQQDEKHHQDWIPLAMWGGLASILIGLAPVILANRYADFTYSRYTLVGVAGAVMILVAGLYSLSSQRLRILLTSILVFVAVFTQFGISLNLVYQADSLRNFWWQVSWRAPSIEAGTNLVASYSLMEAPEDYVIWGPANLIYYPEKQDTIPIKIHLPASVLNRETAIAIISQGNGRDRDRRGNFVHEDYSAVLVLTQPTPGSCVRILDGSMPELSPQDRLETMLIAPHSLIGNVNASPSAPVLPPGIFGQEPEHGWCYFYEKAAYAAQMKDWETVLALGEEAAGKGFQPLDPVEWTPFLRAYVVTGQKDALKPYQTSMNSTPFLSSQTCRILKQTATETRPDDTELMISIEEIFCRQP